MLQKAFFSAIYVYIELFVGLFVSILIARTLGPGDYGVYSYLMRLTMILLILINGGVATGLIRFVAESTRTEKRDVDMTSSVYRFFVRIQYKKLILVMSIFLLVLHFGLDVVQPDRNSWIVVLLSLGVIVKSLYMFDVGLFKGLERFDALAKAVMIVSPTYLVFVAVGVYLSFDLMMFIWVYLVISSLYFIIARKLAYPHLKAPIGPLSDDFQNKASSYVKVTAVNIVLATLVLGYVEIIFLENFATNEEVGFFNIGLMLSTAAMGLIPGVYNNILLPRIVKRVGHLGSGDARTSEFLFSTIRHMLILTLWVAAPLAFYSAELIAFLFGEEFHPAAIALAWIIIAMIWNAFNNPIIGYLGSKDKQLWLLKVNAITLVLSLIVSYTLIMNYGLLGAIISFGSISSFWAICLLALVIYYTKKVTGIAEIGFVFLASIMSLGLIYILPLHFLGFFDVILGTAIYTVAYMSLIWLINGVNTNEKQYLKNAISKLKQSLSP